MDQDPTDKSQNLPAKKPSTTLRFQPYKPAAGGMGALLSVFREANRHTGLIEATKLLTKMNQPDGFDCPGCAWPDPDAEERTAFEFCENGAKAIIAEGTRKRVDPDFFAQWSVHDLLQQTDHWLEAQGRLTHPMIREPGSDHYKPIDWEDAFSHIGQSLTGLDSPDEAIFYTSGRTKHLPVILVQTTCRTVPICAMNRVAGGWATPLASAKAR